MQQHACVRKGQPSRTCSRNNLTHTHTEEVFHVLVKESETEQESELEQRSLR